MNRRLAVQLALACACACTPATSTSTPGPAAATIARPAPTPGPAAEHPTPAAPVALPLDPAILELLTAHRDPPPAAAPVDARSPCHPDRPDSPLERSRCACESACARPIDRASIARRIAENGGGRERAQRWLDAREPGNLHYPYVETDGLYIEFDGDGKVTRCTHSFSSQPGSAVALDCATLPRPSAQGPMGPWNAAGARGRAPAPMRVTAG